MSDSATPWSVACQAPLSMEFSQQQYWSRLPFLFPGEVPNQGIEPPLIMHLLHWQRDSLPLSRMRSVSCKVQNFLASYTSLIMKTHQSFTSENDKLQISHSHFKLLSCNDNSYFTLMHSWKFLQSTVGQTASFLTKSNFSFPWKELYQVTMGTHIGGHNCKQVRNHTCGLSQNF